MALLQHTAGCLTSRGPSMRLQSSSASSLRSPGPTRIRVPLTVKAENEGRYFDEGAAQVRNLLNRDRKELMGVEEIGLAASTEFDEVETQPKAAASSKPYQEYSAAAEREEQLASRRLRIEQGTSTSAPASRSASSSPFGSTPDRVNPFGGSSSTPRGLTDPFASGVNAKKPLTEPRGLSPDMQPSSMEDEPWWKTISFGQVVIVLSFTTIIGLMLATFWVVLNAGGVKFNE